MSDSQQSIWTEERKREFLKYLGQNLVALCGTKIRLNDKGEQFGIEYHYNYTGCVTTDGSKWFVLTAGHAIIHFLGEIERKEFKITCGMLADMFGVNAKHKEAIPFDLIDAEKVYIDDESLGLDYAIIELHEMHKNLLKTNGIMPLPLCPSNFSKGTFYRYFIVGFPFERTDAASTSTTDPISGVILQPNCIPITRIDDDLRTVHPRFAGTIIEMGDLGSIVGMSGGPIFGVIDKGESQECHLLALQSRWDKKSRTVYGCLLNEICAHIQQKQKN